MVYSLTCGKCGVDNFVDSDFPVMEWSCPSCDTQSITSLPTTDGSTLVTDVNFSDVIVATNASEIQGDVVIGIQYGS